MKLNKDCLGNLITIVDEKNVYGKDLPFVGININKDFMTTVANTNNVDNKKYKIVKKNRFVFSGMQTGRDDCIRIGLYLSENEVLVSPAYTTFEVTSNEILTKYLFMIFNSKEKDRYGSFLSDSSIRANLDWERFCNIELVIPPIEIQKKYVAVYESLLHNLKVYESKLDDLKLVCDGYIEEKRRKNADLIGNNIVEINKKNINKVAKMEMGVSIGKEFIFTKAKSSVIENQKLVEPGMFAYNSNTSRNSDTISLALNDSDTSYAVSNTYITFKCTDMLISRYLNLWFKRKEFDRFARFNSWGSARETIGIDELKRAAIAIPTKNEQVAIINIYNAFNRRKQYVDALKRQIQNICPILIKGSIDECR